MNWSYILGWIVVIFIPVSLSAQVTCNGTFGDNIFREGDFGSGRDNIVSGPVSIAPGYTYTINTPPSDGFYTITNDMSKWVNTYSSWIAIGDHSNDPQGYMMVVNASHSPGKFYEQIIDSLCNNTIYEFSADIINVVMSNVTEHILPDLDFMINDSVWYSTGKIPQDEKWYKHGFVFSLKPGQTSVKLTLVNKAPGGTGNDLAIDNITFRPCGPEPDPDMAGYLYFCEDETLPVSISTQIDTNQFSIQWQTTRTHGLNWEDTGGPNMTSLTQDIHTAGTYYYRYKISTSVENLDNPYCLSYSESITAEVLPLRYELWDTICAGLFREFGDQIFTNSGDYTASYISSQGCDSIVTLHLEVVDRKAIEFETEVVNPLCYDSADGKVELANITGGYPPYEYIVDGKTNPVGVFDGLMSGVKIIEINDHFGCQFSSEIELINPPIFELYVVPDTQLILGQPLTITIAANESVSSITTDPDILQDCTDCNTVTFIPVESTNVLIKALNSNGCISTESFFIEVDVENLPIVFPNVFTPNGDGINDDFRIIAPPYLIRRILSARILDRWGNVIHAISEDPDVSGSVLWDGNAGTQEVEPGTYAYVCKVELINGDVRLFSGEVMVLGL